jgi:hypothetical protein
MPPAKLERKVVMKRLVFAAVFLAAALPAAADIIHVPGDYPTIQQGIDAAVSGDIVLVAPGRYVEEIQLKAGVVVRGAGEGKSIIDGGGDAGEVVRAIGNSIRNDTKLSGFSILGAADGGGIPGGSGIFCNSGAAPEISNCRVESCDAGIALWNGSNAFIHNNVICHNTYYGFSTGSGATFVNNTVHANSIGVEDYSGYGPVVMNNIITANRTYGVYGPSGGQGPILTYNNAWGNATNYYQATPGVGSDSVDPLYVDTTAGDYHLGPGSPCIDYGNPAPEYNDPDGTRNDMGAYGGPGAASNRLEVTSLDPAQNALNVPADATLAAGFSQDMDGSTLNARTVRLLGSFSGWHWGTVAYDSAGRAVTLEPDGAFFPGEPATATLTKDIRSQAGDTLPGYTWGFTVASPGGSARFSDTSRFSALGNTGYLATADFNNDGALDLCLARYNANQVAVYLGNGDGTFQSSRNLTAGTGPLACVCADLNGDTLLDIAASNRESDNVSVFIGLGGGTFAPAVNYACGSQPEELAAGDFDADGDVDFAVICYESSNLVLLDNYGDGTFASPRPVEVNGDPVALAAVDVTNDGALDLLVADIGGDAVVVLEGSGTGSFDTLGRYQAGIEPCFVRAGDFNEDGNLDAVAVNMTSNNISVWPGDGAGGLGSRTNYAVGTSPRQVTVADLDGDGHLDLAVSNKVGNSITVFRGTGTGTFGAAQTWDPDDDPLPITPGDFDGDGDLDLAVGNYSPQGITLLFNDDALTATALDPGQYEVGAPDSTRAAATFNQALDPSTLDSASFKVSGTLTGLHPGAIAYDSATFTASLDPALRFAPGEQVTAMLTKAIRSQSGVNLKGFGWTFATTIGAASAGTFGPAATYSSGTEVRGAWAADFDADGDFDLAVTSNSPAAVAVLKNNGDGTFAAPAFVSVQSDPISLFGADLDSDRDVDLACFHNQPGSSHLEILKNNGAGIFTVAATYAPAVLGQSVTGTDFDADGDVDLVLCDGWGSQDNVRVMTNNGSGSFTGPRNYSAGSWAHGAAAIDAENDGDFDLAVANSGNNSVSLLYNDGTGVFSRQSDFGVGSSPNHVYANDLNGDGFADLVVANSGESNAGVLLNNGSGAFLPVRGYPTGGTAQALAGADLNGDNDIDLCFSNVSGNALAVLANNGDGTFAAPDTYAVGTRPWDCVAADFNRDGALDLACANYNSNNVAVLFATGLGVSNPSLITPRSALSVFPNPFHKVLSINCKLQTADCKLRIYDAQGRLVRVLCLPQSLAPNPYSLTWDARDNSGRRVAPGLYFVTIANDNGRASAKVVLSR